MTLKVTEVDATLGLSYFEQITHALKPSSVETVAVVVPKFFTALWMLIVSSAPHEFILPQKVDFSHLKLDDYHTAARI